MRVGTTAVVLALAATSTQLIGGAVASAAPGEGVGVVNAATGEIVGAFGSRITVLDVRTGQVISMALPPGPGDGSEFFLDRPRPLPAAPDYAGDGSEFRRTW